jgi:tRNA pseudouridine55 synthase
LDASGFLNVDKPAGWTSFRVAALVRRRSGVRRVGHTGTLDPTATGVLLVCLGAATRLSEYVMELSKTYRAEIRLGVATDTFDAAGAPVSEADPAGVSRGQVEEALANFLGEIEQVPPLFSAIKHAGEPLYRYARSRREVQPRPRRVVVHRLELLDFRPPLLTIELECGKGTYVRSLAHDLGQRLGCGAHLASLVRLRVGPFTLEDACTLPRLEQAFDEGCWQELLLPPDAALAQWSRIDLTKEEATAVRYGQTLAAADVVLSPSQEPADGALARAYGPEGELLAILRYGSEAGVWHPTKVFAAARGTRETEACGQGDT